MLQTAIKFALAAAIAAAAARCPAQSWELGVAAGYAAWRNGSVYAPAGKACAGIRDRFAVSAILGEDLYEHLGGEFRYTYQDGDPFLEAGALKANIQGQSHSFHYQLLVSPLPRRNRVRPYLAAGIGAKFYRVTGPENPVQALAAMARLKSDEEFKPLAVGGGGLRLRLSPKIAFRLEFLDYVTPFPKRIIQPAPGGTARGILHQFTTLAGISLML